MARREEISIELAKLLKLSTFDEMTAIRAGSVVLNKRQHLD
jgi:hypothetical protein